MKANERIKLLIELLQLEHIEYNQTVESYEENGEEEFSIWLDSILYGLNLKQRCD